MFTRLGQARANASFTLRRGQTAANPKNGKRKLKIKDVGSPQQDYCCDDKGSVWCWILQKGNARHLRHLQGLNQPAAFAQFMSRWKDTQAQIAPSEKKSYRLLTWKSRRIIFNVTRWVTPAGGGGSEGLLASGVIIYCLSGRVKYTPELDSKSNSFLV